MLNVLRFLFRTLDRLRRLVLNLLFIVIIIFVVVSLRQGSEKWQITIPYSAVLTLNPYGTLVEQKQGETTEIVASHLLGDVEPQIELRDLLDTIYTGADDGRVAMLVLELDGLTGISPAQQSELATALVYFKTKAKPILAWGSGYEQSQYALAAYADEIHLDPLGMVMLEGYGVYNNYYREALDKLSVDMNVFRVGQYKSAVEPLQRDNMSAAAQRANFEWLNSLWQDYLSGIQQARKLPAATLARYINQYPQILEQVGGDAAAAARNNRLVDALTNYEDFSAVIENKLATLDAATAIGTLDDHEIDYVRYLGKARQTIDPDVTEQRIGVIVVEGALVDEAAGPGYVTSTEIESLLEQALERDDIAALVLRINSPGGSVYASERIRRAVQRVKSAGLPVLVSMGATAASGGYWIAANADQIWASPTTITGSIGIFGVVPTFQNTLKKLGVSTDGVGTTPLAGAWRQDMPLSSDVRRIIKSVVNHGYQQFITVVAEGRNLPTASVAKVAQGRVWSGRDAHAYKLVDHLGGLQDTINAAVELAELSHFKVEYLQPPRTATEQFLLEFSQQAHGVLGQWQPSIFKLPMWQSLTNALPAQPWLKLNDPKGQYAYCFCAL